MVELRYQWGVHEPRDSPIPQRRFHARWWDHTHRLWLGERLLWTGSAQRELLAWARWCALSVSHLWDCPQPVRTFLEEGQGPIPGVSYAATAPAVREPQRPAAQATAHVVDLHKRAAKGLPQHNWQIRNVAPVTTHALCREVAGRAAREVALDETITGDLRQRTRAAALAAIQHAEPRVRRAQADHLRSLLLHRALPPELAPLIDSTEPGAQAVLIDALLEHLSS